MLINEKLNGIAYSDASKLECIQRKFFPACCCPIFTCSTITLYRKLKIIYQYFCHILYLSWKTLIIYQQTSYTALKQISIMTCLYSDSPIITIMTSSRRISVLQSATQFTFHGLSFPFSLKSDVFTPYICLLVFRHPLNRMFNC